MKSIYQVVGNRKEDNTSENSIFIHNSLDKAIKEAQQWIKEGNHKEVRIKVFRTIQNREGYTFRETWYVE